MAQPLTLFDLFGEGTIAGMVARWPQFVQPTTGFLANSPPPDFSVWLRALNQTVAVQDVRTGANGDRVAVEAKLAMTLLTDYPAGFPFVIGSMPDVELRLQYATPAQNLIHLFASISDRGAEIVLERVPVEIRLPRGLIAPHPSPDALSGLPAGAAEYTVGDFSVDRLDDLKIVYRRDEPTSVFVHVRVHVTEDGEFDIRTAVPVSFGPCLFSGIPCLAVHDFQLIPSPSLAPSNVSWLRHSVLPWTPALVGPMDGCFSIRSVQVDPDTPPLDRFAHWLHDHGTPTAEESVDAVTVTPPPPGSKGDTHAEFVLDDLVIPFFSPWAIPIPRHVTIGIRRRIIDGDDPKQAFEFDQAPVRIAIQRDPPTGLIVNSLFYTSGPGGGGLTFDAVVVAMTEDKDGKNHPVGFEIALDEDYTLALGYRRDIDPATKLPVVATAQPFASLDKVLHYEIVTITIDIVSLKLGFSFGRAIGNQATAAESMEALIDLFVTMPPSGFKGIIELKSLNGEQVKFILEGIGWRFGALQIDGVQLPDGVMILIASKFAIIIQELGIRAEQGATYFSFSGGVALTLSSFEGGLTVRRLRFRIAGNPGAAPFKLDGFFLFFRTKTFYLEAGGYYTEEHTALVSRREFGLTGTIGFEAGGKKFKLSLDFIIGHVTTTTPPEDFMYVMVQIVLTITIEIECVELLSFRLLFARNMKPKLQPVDQNAHDLRYYKWYRDNDPLTVPGERRLASWQSVNDAIAVGAGFGISLAGCGTVFDLTSFALFLWGPDEKGLLIVVELRLLGNPKAVGYLAIELDFQHGRWSGILGVALTIDNFVSNAPEWLAKIGQLTGTIFFGNDPNTFAIGRLNDQRTWLGVRFQWTVSQYLTLHADFILCIEIVENGPKGFGFTSRFEGKIDAGVVQVVFSMGMGIMFSTFTTASHDFAFVAWLDAAFRIVAFSFLHFGVSASVTGRNVGSMPSRGELRFEVHLETPWFLPDLTWTWEVTFGSLAPADLATSTSPLTSAGALEGPQQKSSAVHAERFDANFANGRASRTFSVNELRAAPRPEATRLANFAADGDVHPVATDATISVDWAVAVNDKLALSPGVAAGHGDQRSGDLSLSYDLVGLAVRRRARFGSDQTWHAVDQRVELPADFSDPSGVKLGGAFSPQAIDSKWDLGVRIDGGPAPKRLLINSVTPFQFATSDPATDEELVRRRPQWPCCPDPKSQLPPIHLLTFAGEFAGVDLDTPRFFSDSASRFDWLRPAVAAEHQLGTLPPGVVVARAISAMPGVLARATFDDDVAYCAIRLAWVTGGGQLSLIARDVAGTIVGTRTVPLAPGSDFRTIAVGGTAPIRRVELCYTAAAPTGSGIAVSQQAVQHHPGVAIEVEDALYIALSDYLAFAAAIACDDGSGAVHAAYEGKGKLFFLPNHEYEIALTTRVTVAHPSTSPTSADVTEYLYFRTKGLPGLNAVQRIGEEIEPYVRSAYDGGRGALYREEPVVLAFAEDFSVAVPLTLRPTGGVAEHTTLLRMQLVVRPDTATTPETPFTSTSADWIVANRAVGISAEIFTWTLLASTGTTTGSTMISNDPYRARLAQITQRPGATCPLADPRRVIGTVLVAPPQGPPDPEDPTKALWPAALAHTATVLVEGAAFVERIVFNSADLSALDRSVDAGSGDANEWSVNGGALVVAAGTARRYAIFGDPSWNHLRLSVRIQLDNASGASAGVALALPSGAAPSDGLFAFIDVGTTGRRLVLARRIGGAALEEMAQVALAAPTDPAEPVTLHVWAFDDTVRATVGDLVVEAERGALREGRVALVALGPARFSNLRLQGLELYAFPFVTSRFRSFHDHVQSWRGEVALIPPDVLGAGTTTGTVGGLWTSTQGEVTAAMQSDAPAAARDTMFARWVRQLGLPLRDEVMQLELSRFVVGGQTTCLLVESPEPIDFTTEVRATLERRVTTTSTPNATVTPGSLLGATFGAPLDRPARRDAVAELFGAVGAASVAAPATATQTGPTILGYARHARGMDIAFDTVSLPPDAMGSDVLIVERVGAAGGTPQARIYRGSVAAGARGQRRATVRGLETDYLSVTGAHSATGLSGVLAGMPVGAVVAIITTSSGTVVSPTTMTTYDDVPVRVIQNGSGRRAIIVPVAGGSAVGLAAGTYRLSLGLDRERWTTTDPPDAVNRYQDSAQLTLVL